jgi:hypothetical protein
MGVSQSILKKAPRFFGSPQSILGELFQNSFRAGARTVTVDWNKESRALQFKDDGCGCKPEDLIVVGESGWGKLPRCGSCRHWSVFHPSLGILRTGDTPLPLKRRGFS